MTAPMVSLFLRAFLFISAEFNKLTKSAKSTKSKLPLENYILLSLPEASVELLVKTLVGTLNRNNALDIV